MTNNPEIVRLLENRNFQTMNPGELMRNNPAALIVNEESYNRMMAHFSLDQFEPPQICLVQTYSPKPGVTSKYLVVDGLTRTKAINDDKKNLFHESIPVRDITASLLDNPLIIPKNEKIKDQKVLTMRQYLRAVIPPTVEHSQIAPDRIAAHLINGWENLVGLELAERFSAIAALSLIADAYVPIATDDMLVKFLKSQKSIMAKESSEERVILEKALIDIASIIREAKLYKDEVARSAFELVANKSAVIGGEEKSIREIYGLLHLPIVVEKLSVISALGEREQKRTQLGEIVMEAIAQSPKTSHTEQTTGLIIDVLKDPELNLAQALSIIKADSPSDAYSETKQEINREKLRDYYLKTNKTNRISSYETYLIDQMGKKTYLDEDEIKTITRTIQAAFNASSKADQFLTHLMKQSDSLIKDKVLTQTKVHGLVADLAKLQVAVHDATSLQNLSKKTIDLNAFTTDAGNELSYLINAQKISVILDKVYKQDIVTGRKERIINYLYQEFGELDPQKAKSVIKELTQLDEDLQTAVINGQMRIVYAEQVQTKRKIETASQPKISSKVDKVEPKAKPGDKTITIFQAPVMSSIAPKVSPERRRQETNNEKLQEIMSRINQELQMVDLEANEVSEQTKTKIEEVLKRLGHLRFNHPDIVRVIKEYQEGLNNRKREKEAQVTSEEIDLTHGAH